MFNYQKLDEAAQAGFDSFSANAEIPLWVAEDDLFLSAWGCGLRQAKDNAEKNKYAVVNQKNSKS